MKTLIVCTSISHGNTRQVAEAIGSVLNAPVVDPDSVTVDDLHDYDLVGFGSGIFNMAFHPRLRELVTSLPRSQGTRAFVFSTSGLPEPPFKRYSRTMSKFLEQRGLDVVGTFSCRAHDTWWPFKPVGGIQKGRPNPADIDAARAFAHDLLSRH